MEAASTQRPSSIRLERWLVGGLALLWAAFLLLQRGNPWDEGEHAHVAWLIGHEHLRPIDDFFQHHLPVLWDVLALYYRAGLGGPWVLVFGRVLVVVCALLFFRTLREVPTWFGGRPALLGPLLFALLTIGIPEWFVVRPETLSAGLLALALPIWARGSGKASHLALAGALFGVSAFSSPRMLLCGPLIAFIGPVLPARELARRYAITFAAGAAAVFAWMAATGFSLQKVVFCVLFSSHLQKVGWSDHGLPPSVIAGFGLAGTLAVLALLSDAPTAARRRGLGILGASTIAFAVSWHIGARFPYPAGFSAAFVCSVLTISFAEGFASLSARVRRLVAACLVGACFLMAEQQRRQPFPSFLAGLDARAAIAALIPPGECVLVFTCVHPVTVRDVSYYGPPLYDSSDRLCRAVGTFPTTLRLPPCSVLADLRKGPFLTISWILSAVAPDDLGAARKTLQERYWYIPPGMQLRWPPMFRGALVRRADVSAAPLGTSPPRSGAPPTSPRENP